MRDIIISNGRKILYFLAKQSAIQKKIKENVNKQMKLCDRFYCN